MDMTTFWRLIDDTRYASSGDPEKHRELLTEALATLSVENIVEFETIFIQLHNRAYDRNLWNAAYIIGCGCGDDGFMDFRGWLIGQGEKIYENALKDPESLAEVIDLQVNIQYGITWNVVPNAYELKTGKQMPYAPIKGRIEPLVLIGDDVEARAYIPEEEWEQQIKQKFPKLAAKFGDCTDRY